MLQRQRQRSDLCSCNLQGSTRILSVVLPFTDVQDAPPEAVNCLDQFYIALWKPWAYGVDEYQKEAVFGWRADQKQGGTCGCSNRAMRYVEYPRVGLRLGYEPRWGCCDSKDCCWSDPRQNELAVCFGKEQRRESRLLRDFKMLFCTDTVNERVWSKDLVCYYYLLFVTTAIALYLDNKVPRHLCLKRAKTLTLWSRPTAPNT